MVLLAIRILHENRAEDFKTAKHHFRHAVCLSCYKIDSSVFRRFRADEIWMAFYKYPCVAGGAHKVVVQKINAQAVRIMQDG